jgi:hypothetical protein
MNALFKTLGRRVQLPANLISLVLLVMLGGLLLHNSLEEGRRRIADKAGAMGDFLAKAGATYLVNSDLKALESFTRQLARDDDFTYLVFFDEKGRPLTTTAPTDRQPAGKWKRDITDSAGKKIGSLELDYSFQSLEKSRTRSIATCLVMVLLAQLIMAVGLRLVTVSLSRYLTKLISSLSAVATVSRNLAGQVAVANREVAEGAAYQVALLCETDQSLQLLAASIGRNEASVEAAKNLVKEKIEAASLGVADMAELSRAVSEIKNASTGISKIIQSIDEIAFQTNILALNTAVEAGRAGPAGAGFAIVAEEIRRLAQRSALAAQETTTKIKESIQASEVGFELNQIVVRRLAQIEEKVHQADELTTQIAQASAEQSLGIEQLNQAMTQISEVTQASAAATQESAQVATALTGQSELVAAAVRELQELVGRDFSRYRAALGTTGRGPSRQPEAALPQPAF